MVDVMVTHHPGALIQFFLRYSARFFAGYETVT